MVRRLAPLALLALAACGEGSGEQAGPKTCAAGTVACGDACVDLRSDEAACGACGQACGSGDTCSAGVCRPACATHRFPLEEAATFAGGENPLAATAIDADGDGRPELVIADSHRKVLVLPQQARREFGPPVELADTNGPVVLAAGDLDEDGRPDLLVGERWEDRVLSLRNTGDGTFAKRWLDRIDANAWGLAVGDLDGDGHLDLVATAPDEGDVVFLRGTGDGTFAEFDRAQYTSEPGQPAIGDFDGDGRADVAFIGGGTSYAHVLFGREGGFDPLQVDGLERLRGLAVGDVDGDGLDDLALSNASGVSVLLGRSTGPFERLPVVPGSARSAVIASGDVDGDGLAELVALGDRRLQVLGHDGAAMALASDQEAILGASNPTLVDLDGDRVLDLITSWPAPDAKVVAIYGECR